MDVKSGPFAAVEQRLLLALARGSAGLWITGGTLAFALFGASAIDAGSVHSAWTPAWPSGLMDDQHCPYEDQMNGYNYADDGTSVTVTGIGFSGNVPVTITLNKGYSTISDRAIVGSGADGANVGN